MLKHRIRNHEKTIGMYVEMAEISIAKMAGLAGYDFVWVDTEHTHMSYETLLGHILALKATGTPVIVRVPQDDLTATKKVLEMGVDGIIFPMIHDAEQANQVISWTLYPPHGIRGFGPKNAADYGFRDVYEYTDANREELCRFVQIEHKDAIDHLDEIIQNPYIDGYIFGPNDLSGSYHMLGHPFDEKITAVMRDAIDRLHAAGKYVGIASGGWAEDVVRHWSSLGTDMLVAGADIDFVRDGAIKNRQNLERIHKNL